MYVGKITGKVVSTQKDKGLEGLKLLIVQPLANDLKPKGKQIIAIDTIKQAGEGDIVYLAKSGESSLPLKLDQELIPSDAGIVGIIDYYHNE